MLAARNFVIRGNHVIGNGVKAEKSFDLGPFDAVSVNGSADVVFVQGLQKVLLVADENLLELFEIEVKDGTLRIGTKKGCGYSTKNDVVVFVNSPVLNAAKINGSGSFEIDGPLAVDGDFSLSVNGSGEIEVDALTAGSASVKVNGSGDVKLNCREVGDIVVGINGSGDVELLGNARNVRSKINGSGNVNTRRLVLAGN